MHAGAGAQRSHSGAAGKTAHDALEFGATCDDAPARSAFAGQDSIAVVVNLAVSHTSQYKNRHEVDRFFDPHEDTYMKLADAFLMPGLVGLGILDVFALEKPFITTNYPKSNT